MIVVLLNQEEAAIEAADAAAVVIAAIIASACVSHSHTLSVLCRPRRMRKLRQRWLVLLSRCGAS